MKIVGIDIGGAHVKYVLADLSKSPVRIVRAEQFAFPFWTDYCSLPDRLASIDEQFAGDIAGVAITMTAELADCFENKQQGVGFIVDSVVQSMPNRCVRFYNTHGQLVDALAAKTHWRSTAASNWHASATFLFDRHQQPHGYLIDVGSTTTDIIPVRQGLPVCPGATDLDRLMSGQLIYAGVGRTPVCSLVNSIKLDSGTASIAREVFATVSDALIWLGHNPPDVDCRDTADGRDRSRIRCRARLCRMLCADNSDFDDQQVDAIAEQCLAEVCRLVSSGLLAVIKNHPELPLVFCLAGQGWQIAQRIIGQLPIESPVRVINSFDDPVANQVIPALAVASRWDFTAGNAQ